MSIRGWKIKVLEPFSYYVCCFRVGACWVFYHFHMELMISLLRMHFLALEMWLMVSSACFHCYHMVSNFSHPSASLYHMFFSFLWCHYNFAMALCKSFNLPLGVHCGATSMNTDIAVSMGFTFLWLECRTTHLCLWAMEVSVNINAKIDVDPYLQCYLL